MTSLNSRHVQMATPTPFPTAPSSHWITVWSLWTASILCGQVRFDLQNHLHRGTTFFRNFDFVAVGVLVSTKPNPSSFNDFNNANGSNQLAVNFFQTSGQGPMCFNIDLSKSGISGVTDGANVSIEVAFDGGDGQLYQVRYVAPSDRIFTDEPLWLEFSVRIWLCQVVPPCPRTQRHLARTWLAQRLIPPPAVQLLLPQDRKPVRQLEIWWGFQVLLRVYWLS